MNILISCNLILIDRYPLLSLSTAVVYVIIVSVAQDKSILLVI